GQGVIVEGKFNNDTFNADTVMAKHDEQYMPREVADKLKEQGVWQGEVTK
ncbi:MAG: cytochrome c maturation protein CcmE, partial [Alphaproteobacteria bacterium]